MGVINGVNVEGYILGVVFVIMFGDETDIEVLGAWSVLIVPERNGNAVIENLGIQRNAENVVKITFYDRIIYGSVTIVIGARSLTRMDHS